MTDQASQQDREAFEKWAKEKGPPFCRPMYGCFGNIMEYRFSEDARDVWQAAIKHAQQAVESDLTNGQILAMLPQIGAILPNIDSGKVELRPVEYRDALRSYAIRAIRALKSQQPAQADKDKDKP